MPKASLETLDQIERDLTEQHSALAIESADVETKLNEIKAIKDDLERRIAALGSKRSRTEAVRAGKKPSAAELRMFVRRVLAKRKNVHNSELMAKVHTHFGHSMPKNVSESPLAASTYQAIASLQKKGYVKRLGKNKRSLSATSRGLNTKSWG